MRPVVVWGGTCSGYTAGEQRCRCLRGKDAFSKLLEKVEAGEEITITKHGAPIAKLAMLVPVKKEASSQERLAAIERIQKLALGLSLDGLKVKDLIREGRR